MHKIFYLTDIMDANSGNKTLTTREMWIDWLRVAACFMVMVVHSTEPFYLGGEGSRILTQTDAFWASFFDSFVRACVPLFIVASSYLQFPLHYSTGEFFRRRATRILIPFVIWTLAYALIWGEPVQNLKDLLLNFNYAAGHLWFVYMLLGVYLLMPLLSPWAERVGRKELSFYLFLCLLTTLIPFIREWATEGTLPIIYGRAGLPRQADFPLWGEASWNGYGTFYYVSGFIGYLLLGLYLRKFVGKLSWRRTLAIGLPCWLAGFALCFGGFLARVFATSSTFPIEGGVSLAVVWETPWYNDTLGVALMTVGWLLLFRQFNAGGRFYSKVLLPVSRASYGMYLCHMFVLAAFSGLFRGWLGIAGDGALGTWTTPVEILLTALATFAVTAIVCSIIQRIPKVGKWIMG